MLSPHTHFTQPAPGLQVVKTLHNCSRKGNSSARDKRVITSQRQPSAASPLQRSPFTS